MSPVSNTRRFSPVARVAGSLALAVLTGIALARAADGDLDPAFGGGVAYAHWATLSTTRVQLAVDPAGAVFVTAAATASGSFDYRFAAAKFRADGSADSSFGFQGLRTIQIDLVEEGADIALGAFVLPGSRLMMLGTAEMPGNASAPALVRLTAAGNADPAFGSNGRRVIASAPWPLADIDIRFVARQRDGKVLFGGWGDTAPQQRSAIVLRVDAEGVPDPAFGDAGWASLPVPWPSQFKSIALDADARIVLAGWDGDLSNTAHVPLLARFLPDGSPDASFGIGTGYVRLVDVPSAPPQGGWISNALAADRDGSLLLALTVDEDLDGMAAGIVRVRANGTLDTGFGIGGLRPLDLENGTRIDALALRGDGRILATGKIQPTGGGTDVLVARLRANGSLDPGFDGNGVVRFELGPDTDMASALAFSAGKPVIAGYADRGTDFDAFALRLQSDYLFVDSFD
ncbi:MAG: hypothetical protein EOP90_11460 [Lysobacteraceae bacterium]|nr:MAG: hypothetical protein EOP90_11460 [Xanthomonadaceae bacterium]